MGFGQFFTESKVHKLKGFFNKKSGKFLFIAIGSKYGPSVNITDEMKLSDFDNSKNPSSFIDETLEEMNKLADGLYAINMEYEYQPKYNRAQGWVTKFTKTTKDKELKKIEKNEAKRSTGIDIKDIGVSGRARDAQRVSNMMRAAEEKSFSFKMFLKNL